ncbi:Sensor protein [Candidatus Glomeribacter gigasporarum BEG34]|uniref:histidine kinase n=1 Tax=Candidatus Glomeribacter gigasporarum BEG34 TaxID=1070319 RepID=G2JAG8_9BURK|nr:ATP-binding protein [Candidatus Glomeribacter gigasporarum]CCD29770.1 Sensor protein [Candidatus Glomeribacter gigasporarum BEG34]
MYLSRIKFLEIICGGLFRRTFLLIALLLSASLAAWVEGVRILEREPHAQRVALQLASIVKLTRAAVQYAHPDLRAALLRDIERNEGVSLYPRTPDDVALGTAARRPLSRMIEADVRQYLGADTVIARSVNAKPGIWISFRIGNTHYWAALDRAHLDIVTGLRWLDWALIALGLSLLGAMLMTYFVNRPFARLARAARQIGAGRMPEQLAEQGSGVIAQTNRSFNQMARDLRQLEEDRTLMLAGISHDLRTPLTRLRLEVEMNSTDAAAQSAMIADIEQIDAILASFLEYARPLPRPLAKVDLALLVRQAAARFARKDSMEIALQLAEPAMIQADAADLRRILDNVLENARKYGRSAEDAIVHVQIALRRQQNQMELLIRDCGPGIAQDQLERVTRPFYRGVAARSQSDGAGLGMAMVQRLVSRCQGALQLRNCSPEPGLEVKLTFPRT